MTREKVVQANYNRIDNDIYNAKEDGWRQLDSPLHLMQSSINPARLGYFKRILFNTLNITPWGKTALEVGCGDGLLSEEIARMGFDVSAIDPAEYALQVATKHAQAVNLPINYAQAVGEALPYRSNCFDCVFCCDVLEHVCDLPEVIAEIARVLKPGGVFGYDTFNRTLMSKLVAINIAQVWKTWAFVPPWLHVWEMFIKPHELKLLLRHNQLEWREHRGMAPNVSFFELLRCLRQRAKGKIGYRELGEKLHMVEGENTSLMYMGYAIKNGQVLLKNRRS